MTTVFLSLLTTLALTSPGHGKPGPAKTAPVDSIGQEMRGGQRFVKHRVTGGETLTAVARRYHVTLDQLNAANPQIKNGLGIGQVVYVPRAAAGKASPAAPATAAQAPGKGPVTVPARYTVRKGETLFGIAQKFQLSPDELIKLNSLPAGGAVRLGQQLLLTGSEAGAGKAATVRPAETEAVPTPKPGETPAPDKPAEVATVTPERGKDREKDKSKDERKDERKDEKEDRSPTRASEVLGRVVETGLGAPIEKSVTDKYLALHKTAPTGTIMQVRNSMNGLSVYVRVIGKLPDTGENNNILVRLSPRAVQKLGTSDAKFRVETNYIPQ